MKTVLVTGGSRGIGKCIAENLAKDGFNVVLNYNKSEKQAKQIQKELSEQGINIEIYKADVSKREEVKKLVQYALEKYKTIDILVNNAGISEYKLFTDETDEDWLIRIGDIELCKENYKYESCCHQSNCFEYNGNEKSLCQKIMYMKKTMN